MINNSYVNEKQLKHMLKVIEQSRGFPVRNLALLMTIYGTGMMLTELAKLPLRAYLRADGHKRLQSEIPAEVAYNRIARPLFWSNAKLTTAVDNYLQYRILHFHGITTRPAYRGLDPNEPLFLTDDGKAYKLTLRKTDKGTVNLSCDTLSQLFRKLHLQAGIEGANASSGRKTFAVRLYNKGFDLYYIKTLLGLTTMTATLNLIGAGKENSNQIFLRKMVSTVL